MPVSINSPLTSRSRRSVRSAGFSLTELLVVIDIIVLLLGILLVALGQVQIRARQTQTESTMQQFLNACTAFQAENERFPGVIPETLLANNPQGISSTENALLDLLGGFRVLAPTDLAGSQAETDYQNYLTAAQATSSNEEYTWNTPSGAWRLVVDTRKIGEGPVINGKPRAPYFTPSANELVRQSTPNNGIPDLVDAWGQPILYLRQLRDRGPLVGPANVSPAPQFLRGGLLPYIQSTALGELQKDQVVNSILNTSPNTDATLARLLTHPAIDNQAKGGICLISAGPDGIYFSRIDGPGSNAAPIDDIVTNPNAEYNNIKVVDDYDDIRIFGGA